MFILYIRFELLAPFVENSQRQDDEAEKESYSLRMRNNEKYIQTNEMCAGLGNQVINLYFILLYTFFSF